MNTARTTYVLEKLEPESTYECYIEARNTHGLGEATPRIVFRTDKKEMMDDEDDIMNDSYNMTSCCVKANVQPDCK